MCAIAGIIDFGGGEGQTGGEQLLNAVFRREQGQKGIYRREPALLLHARPPLARWKGGRQPFVLSARGGLALVCTGTLENGDELRGELAGLGHRFEGDSDGETAARAYAEWGAECVKRLEGGFAFAVWAEECRRLFLARDREGAEPLFFSREEGRLCFASEREILPDGPAADRGIGDIRELEGGNCAYWSQAGWKRWRY